MTVGIHLNEYQRFFVCQLHDAQVRFLVLGGIAMQAHGLERETHDLDLLIDRCPKNCDRLLPVLLRQFRNRPASLTTEWLSQLEKRIPLPGGSAHEIDVLSSCGALEFETAYRNRLNTNIESVQLSVLGLRELIYSKLASADRNEDPRAVVRDIGDLGMLLELWQSRHGNLFEINTTKEPD